MISEASRLLTSAGEMFKQVLECEGWSSRALVNWGRAMCVRAELASEVRGRLAGWMAAGVDAVICPSCMCAC